MKHLAFVLQCVLFFGCSRLGQPAIPAYFAVPDFSLLEQSGKTVTLHDLAGKVWVADFIFTNCGGTCPAMTEKMPDAAREYLLKQTALGRAGKPEDVSGVVRFLCSDAAGYITGQTLVVDGGVVM